jgi:pilus assembly protein Flp/PilA
VAFLQILRAVAAPRTPGRESGEEDGQSMVEYGVIVAMIAVVVMVAVQALGTSVAGVFTRIVGRLGGIG